MNATILAALTLCAAPGDAVVVQFLSPNCPHCKAMEPLVAKLADAGCPVQVVDVDKQPDVAQQFKLTGVPTFVGLAQGRETGRIVGATTYEKLLKLYQQAQGGKQDVPAGPSPANALPADPTSPAHLPAEQAGPPASAESAALAASVRLKVEDGRGFGYGTGTIIDTHENEALVVTCGHLFRESQGQGKIAADVFAGGSLQTVEGELLEYDLDHDIALVSLRVPFAVQAAIVGPPGCSVRPGDRVFSVGCDKGQDPTVRRSHITAVNKYVGRPNYTAAGQPVDGRSGGGLFTADGVLIGICNAADPADDEGLYAALGSIHWQLDQIGQSEIYQRPPPRDVAAVPQPVSLPSTASPPEMAAAANPSPGPATAEFAAVVPASYAAAAASPQQGYGYQGATGAVAPASYESRPVAAADDTEIVFIVRSKSDPSQRSEVYVVDGAPPDLVARITHAARNSGQQRAAAAAQQAAGLAAAAAGYGPGSTGTVVRGQSQP